MKRLVFIASDHAGYALKGSLCDWLCAEGYEPVDLGPADGSVVDYPRYGHRLAAALQKADSAALGILLCGTGNGMAMVANRTPAIRAALCWAPRVAELVRAHNDANVLCLPARFLSLSEAKGIAQAFFETAFEGGRHTDRLRQIDEHKPVFENS